VARRALVGLVSFFIASMGWEGGLDGKQILKKMLFEAPDSNYVAVRNITLTAGKKKIQIAQKIVHRKTGEERIEFLSPPSLAGKVIITGQAREEEIDILSTRKILNPDAFMQLLKNYDISLEGRDQVAGRSCAVVRISPKMEGRPSRRLWIDTANYIVMKAQETDFDGKDVLLMEISEISFPLELDKKLFERKQDSKEGIGEFEPLAGVQEAKGIVGGGLRLPSYIPQGFVLHEMVAIRSGSSKAVMVGYVDGLCAITILIKAGPGPSLSKEARAVKIGDVDGLIKDMGVVRIVQFQTRGLTYTIVSELSEKEIEEIAISCM
jgi:negative regulator of sigma E activity